jgi:hypothetical protein
VRSRGVGRTIRGVDGGTASWRRSSGNEVDGDDGRRVRIGVGEAVVSDNGNNEERPRGMSRRISTSASSVNYLSARNSNASGHGKLTGVSMIHR